MNDDTIIVPPEDLVVVLVEEDWTIEVPAELRIIEVDKPCY